jgi:hypothetical protein
MTNNILCNSTFLGVGEQVEPNMIEWRKSGKKILTIHADGRITVSEDLKPTETAAKVLQIMRDQWLADAQCAKIRELQGRIEALNRGNAAAERILCDAVGVESGRDVLDWIVAAKDRIKRLEEALEATAKVIGPPGKSTWVTDDELNNAWELYLKAKEAKP